MPGAGYGAPGKFNPGKEAEIGALFTMDGRGNCAALGHLPPRKHLAGASDLFAGLGMCFSEEEPRAPKQEYRVSEGRGECRVHALPLW